MMKTFLTLAMLIFLSLSAYAAVPGDAAEGERLHDANCTGCHDSAVYTRKDRHVQSLNGLKQQVENCTHMAKKKFSPAQRQDIVKYLDEQFYRFK